MIFREKEIFEMKEEILIEDSLFVVYVGRLTIELVVSALCSIMDYIGEVCCDDI